jgi:hypothetical protein
MTLGVCPYTFEKLNLAADLRLGIALADRLDRVGMIGLESLVDK